MVEPSATATLRQKNGRPRLALSEPSMGSTTTVVGPPPPKSRVAELLADQPEARAAGGHGLELADDDVLRGAVDGGGGVAALAAADDLRARGPGAA